MVSFWPFKGQDTSAASFEKLLSSLSTKINKETARNDGLRKNQRRYRVLWSLYTSFAYILAALILTLVTGWQNWTPIEYTGLASAPLLIYAVRTAIDAFFNYRLLSSQRHLDDLLKQREVAITKLKDATKYNSTQQLLEKYGGVPPKPAQSASVNRNATAGQGKQQQQQQKPTTPRVARTGLPPPPTANIPGRNPPPLLQDPARQSSPSPVPHQPLSEPSAEFAPNAFSAPPPPPSQSVSDHASAGGHRWLDRLLDVVLGDDETQPKNRIALICSNCRLVNGQAPPGTRSLGDVGAWRCMGCHALNGQESEAKQMIQQIVAQGHDAEKQGVKRRVTTLDGADGDMNETKPEPVEAGTDQHSYENVSEPEGEDGVLDSPPAASTRSKARQRNKR